VPIVVRSPHSGRPVKVREEDVGRAVRDEAGRVFYVVTKDDGTFYSSLTRHGSEKDEQRYAKIEAGEAVLTEQSRAAQADRPPLHDATGKRRSSSARPLLWLILLLILAAVAYHLAGDPLGLYTQPSPAPATQPAATPTAQPDESTEEAAPPPPEPRAPRADVSPAVIGPEDGQGFRRQPTGLQVRVEAVGEGEPALTGTFVLLRYRTLLPGGRVVDQTGPAQTAGFVIGSGQMMPGWDLGIVGMRPGGKRTLRVPGKLTGAAYPPGLGDAVALVSEIELVETRPGVAVEVAAEGEGPRAKSGQSVAVAFSAYVVPDADADPAGEPVMTSDDLGGSMVFTVGTADVIPGLSLGVRGMRVGEVRALTVPPYLAYGKRGAAGGLIPPNATLRYHVELISIDGSAEPSVAERDGLRRAG